MRPYLCLLVLSLFALPMSAQWSANSITANNLVDRSGQRALTVDSSNTLHATWSQTHSNGTAVVYYSMKPCQSPWSTPEILSDTVMSASGASMALDTHSQEVAVAWSWPPSNGSNIHYSVGNSGNWTQIQVSNSINTDLTPSAAIDGAGAIHLAWTSEDTSGTWKIHYAHNRFGGFMEQRIALSNPGPFGGGASPKIALDQNGAPSITYREGNFNTYKIERLWLSHPDSTNWSNQFLNTPLGEEFVSDQVIDDQGTIHVALSGNSGFGFPVDAYYMKKPLAGNWTAPVVIDILQNSHVVNIFVDDQHVPHVGLEGLSGNFYTGNVYYATEGPTGWTNSAINTNFGSNYAFGANVVVDGQTNVHAFGNMDNGVATSTAEVIHWNNGSCLICAVIPGFTASDTSICEGETVQFTNSTAGASSYAWYEDGILFDTTANTSRLFTTAGTRTIMLVGDNGTCSDTLVQTIHINAFPVAGFNFPPEDSILCEGGSINFTNTSTGATSYRWYDNSVQFSTSLNASRMFIAPGLRTIQLVARNGVCHDTAMTTIRVVPNPFASFTFPIIDTAICVGDTINFTNNSTNSSVHTWIQNGVQFDTSYHTSRVFTAAGTQTITLIEREGDCRDTAMANVAVYAAPIADFSFVTALRQVDFTDLSVGNSLSWAWDFGDGNTDTQQDPSHTYAADGTYWVCLEVMNSDGCMGVMCDSVTVLGTGIQDELGRSEMLVYPNPSQGRFVIELGHPGRAAMVQLCSIEGKTLRGEAVLVSADGRLELDYARLAAGSYILRVEVAGVVYRERVVIFE